jgi:hypothetical protein
MRANPVITDFTAGELSPKLEGRFDLEVYRKGVKTLTNWVPISQGGITLRPGTEYLGATKNNGKVRLVPFIVNETVSYILEIGNAYIRFWKDGSLIEDGGNPVEANTPYTSLTHIFELHYCQVYNKIYVVHRNYPPQVLTWTGGDSFTFAAVSFTGNSGEVPFQSANNYPGCITAWNGRLCYASSINDPQRIWASKPFDYATMTYFDTIEYTIEQLRDPSYDFTGDTTSGSADITNISDTDMDYMKVGDRVEGPGIPDDSTISSIGTNNITLNTTATATATGVSLTRKWADPSEPETKTVTTSKDVIGEGHAFTIEIASEMNDKIMWLASGTDLVIGTESSEWILYRDATALWQSARLQTRFGSAPLQGLMVNDALVFVQGSKTRIREYHYHYETNGYRSPDLTFFADHMLSAGVVEFDYMNEPDPTVFFVLSDGTVAALLYNKLYNVFAWYRIQLQESSEMETVAVVPGAAYDEIYCIVKRGTDRYLEKFARIFYGYHVDCGISVVKSGGTASGLDHLDGETVSIVYNGSVWTDTVSGGSVSLDDSIPDGKTVHIGLPFTAEAKSMRLGRQTKPSRMGNPAFRLLESYAFKVGYTDQSEYLEAAAITDSTTGDIDVPFRGDWTKDGWITIVQDTPLPVTILCIVAEVYQ